MYVLTSGREQPRALTRCGHTIAHAPSRCDHNLLMMRLRVVHGAVAPSCAAALQAHDSTVALAPTTNSSYQCTRLSVTRGWAETTTPGCHEDTVPKLGAVFKHLVAALLVGNAPGGCRHHIVACTLHTPRDSSAAPRPAACARRPSCRPPAARL
jgi:hypothetical protein